MTTAENIAAEVRGLTIHLVGSAITRDYCIVSNDVA